MKTLRILRSIKFFHKTYKKQQVRGPFTSSEIEKQREFLIKEEKHRYSKCERFELSKQQLSEEGLYSLTVVRVSNSCTKKVQISRKIN